MNQTRTILGFTLLALVGCFDHQNSIPDGVYIHLETGNTIEIKEHQLTFYIKKKSTDILEPLTVSYKLFPDGRMELGTSTDPAIFSLIESNWFFVPPEIHRKERNNEDPSARFAPSVE